MELLERVALLVEGYQWDSGEAETEARLIAKSILAIPEIREALHRSWPDIYPGQSEHLHRLKEAAAAADRGEGESLKGRSPEERRKLLSGETNA